MKRNLIKSQVVRMVLALVATAASAYADTIIPGGAVGGTWNVAGSPYIVQGSISVAYGTGLTIDPGVVVRFQAGTGVEVRGTLLAEGTAMNPILFTSDQTVKMPGDWAGITGISAPTWTASIRLSNCRVEYAGNGIYVYATGSYGLAAVYFDITNTAVHSCSGSGILASGFGSQNYTASAGRVYLSVSGCNIYSNGLDGIRCYGSQSVSAGSVIGAIRNCTFVKNGRYGVSTDSDARYGDLPEVSNNVIWGNGASGININAWPHKLIRNNIVVSNAVGISANLPVGYPLDLAIIYNDVWGNGANWYGAATAYAPSVGNISTDPLCANPEASDFHLRSQAGRYDPATATWIRDSVSSPCIDAGDPGVDFSSEPQPNGGRINLGAYGGSAFASKSLPRIASAMDKVTKNYALSWSCAPGETYTVLYSASLAGPWLDDLPGCQLTAGPSQTTLSYTNVSAGTQTNRFCRIRWNTP
jgi:hypothetical protein